MCRGAIDKPAVRFIYGMHGGFINRAPTVDLVLHLFRVCGEVKVYEPATADSCASTSSAIEGRPGNSVRMLTLRCSRLACPNLT
jgi:hypothetical protein